MSTVPYGYAESVCRFGAGPDTCAFLALEGGWTCAKSMPSVAAIIRERLANGTMGAKGDNCSGPPDFTPNPDGS